ncbi:hypothetical protein FPQ18DRAFT_379767 [Pyronema domesticum]|nr:hypothetical protein FPQ18DRAFT_379767 [Pyronema domesticum]
MEINRSDGEPAGCCNDSILGDVESLVGDVVGTVLGTPPTATVAADGAERTGTASDARRGDGERILGAVEGIVGDAVDDVLGHGATTSDTTGTDTTRSGTAGATGLGDGEGILGNVEGLVGDAVNDVLGDATRTTTETGEHSGTDSTSTHSSTVTVHASESSEEANLDALRNFICNQNGEETTTTQEPAAEEKRSALMDKLMGFFTAAPDANSE